MMVPPLNDSMSTGIAGLRQLIPEQIQHLGWNLRKAKQWHHKVPVRNHDIIHWFVERIFEISSAAFWSSPSCCFAKRRKSYRVIFLGTSLHPSPPGGHWEERRFRHFCIEVPSWSSNRTYRCTWASSSLVRFGRRLWSPEVTWQPLQHRHKQLPLGGTSGGFRPTHNL